MKNITTLIAVALILTISAGCAPNQRHHATAMPDPKAYNAHFPDLDGNGDDLVTRDEFKSYFPDANQDVYNALDLNGDGSVDHDEWHQFKEAHGLGHHKKE